ncbi:MAG: prepilin peptidase [Pirellulaceae bacterium]|jgi:leader peptidase (prepilin peptidase)/N-methyltransferase|nr:prepilin peptidase [Pirellulaceae bacterium]
MVRRRRRRRSNPAFWLLAAIVGALVIYVSIPVWRMQTADPGAIQLAGLSLGEILRERVLHSLTALWVFFFGACFGSFLNVVVHRLPAGESIAWNPSRCPYCRVPIRASDNIPVFAWLSLRGRCRACRLPISSRYPIVEATCGIGFLLFAAMVIAANGVNLPVGFGPPRPLSLVVLAPPWTLVVICLHHAALLFALFGWALMEYDDQKAPWTYAVWWLLFGLAVAVAAPFVTLIPWSEPSVLSYPADDYLRRLESPLAGAALGLACGFCLTFWRPVHKSNSLVFAIVGVFLGWQATLSIGVLALLLSGIFQPIRRARFLHSSAGVCLVAVGIHLTFWKYFAEVAWWPGSSPVATTGGCALLMCWMLTGALPRKRPEAGGLRPND